MRYAIKAMTVFPLLERFTPEQCRDVAETALARVPPGSQDYAVTVRPGECRLEIFDLDEATKR